MQRIMGCSKHRRWHSHLVAVGLAVGGMIASGFNAPLAARPLRVGDRMPAFQTKTIDGKPVSSASFKNRPLWLVFFMST